jgi:glycosyltransferase involved in cell wall biosynthesis
MKPNVMLLIPEMCTGGAQRSLAKLSVEFAHHATVSFVVFNHIQPFAYTVGGEIFSLEVYPKNNWFHKSLSFWQRVRRLRELKKRLKIDVCISFLEGADYINVLSKRTEKVILSIRGSKLHDEIMQAYLFSFRTKLLIPWLYRRADLIIAINQGITNELTKVFKIPKNRVRTIYNFYDFDEINLQAKEPKVEYLDSFYDFPVLITAGRLASEKRLTYLLEVFVELKKTKNNVKFIFIGDGPELTSLLQFCRDMKLNTNGDTSVGEIPDVIFMGNQENVFKYLKGSSVFLLNSSSEGLPNGMIEAMICGIPVISSDCPYGPREILAPDLVGEIDDPFITPSGILMPLANSEKNLQTWAHIVLSVLNDAQLRHQLSEGARKRGRAYDKQTIMREWLNTLKSK